MILRTSPQVVAAALSWKCDSGRIVRVDPAILLSWCASHCARKYSDSLSVLNDGKVFMHEPAQFKTLSIFACFCTEGPIHPRRRCRDIYGANEQILLYCEQLAYTHGTCSSHHVHDRAQLAAGTTAPGANPAPDCGLCLVHKKADGRPWRWWWRGCSWHL